MIQRPKQLNGRLLTTVIKEISKNRCTFKRYFWRYTWIRCKFYRCENASYDDKGRLVTGDTVNNYTVTNKKNGFDLQFNEDINSAYVITYKTKPTNNVIKDGKIKNTVTADNGSSKENEVGFQQQNIIKSNNKAETNYKDKTTTWTITVNNNNYPLNNAIITDTFDHGGLQLKDKN